MDSITPDYIDKHITADGTVSIASLRLTSTDAIVSSLRRYKRTESISALDFSGNELTDFDASAFTFLKNLRKLDLSRNRLTSFPDRLYDLTNLRSLNLDGNGIRRVKIDGCRFPALRELSITRNGLENISGHLEALPALEILDLSGNLLGNLPAEVARLRSLRELRIGENPGLLPHANITKLKRLRLLDLSNNRLQSLPAELGQLHRDITIKLQGNFLDDVLRSAAAGEDSRKVLEVLRSRSDASPNYEAKLLLVGEGNVGKTSLVEALLRRPFVEGRPTTHGIEIKTVRISNPLPDTEEPFTFRSWDFGGQEIYRITNQFFFSARAIYLVVWRPREGRDENAVEAWLERIWLRVGDQAKTILIATHGGERRAELDLPRLSRRFGSILSGSCTVDSRTGGGLKALETMLGDAAAGLPQMGSPVSRRWMAVRDELLTSTEAHVKRSFFDRICDRNDVPDGEADVLAQLLADLGYIVYFPDDLSLRDIIVLQPEWLTTAISIVLEDQQTVDCGGILDHRRLATLWSEDSGLPVSFHPYFLRLMEKFDVSYRVPDFEKSLIGQLVPYARPDFASNINGSSDVLKLYCQFSEDPTGLIPWLIVRNHRFSTGVHWRHGVLLRHPTYETDGIFELIEPRVLALSVHGKASGFFLDILRDTLEYLCSLRWPGLKYDLSVPCRAEGCRGKFPLRSLERLREARQRSVQCLECINVFDVQQLLTGFESMPGVTMEIARRELSVIQRGIAHNLLFVRTIIKALSAEVVDCPRLFTIALRQSGSFDRLNFWSMRYSLALWCEEPGAEHPAGLPYLFRKPRQWFVDVAPYLRIAARVVSVAAPVVGSAAALADDAASGVERTADLMKAIADAVNSPVPSVGSPQDSSALTPAEGAALRRFRELLLELDPSRGFRDLQRILSPTGDYLWLCADHYRTYEPPLPKLSYGTA